MFSTRSTKEKKNLHTSTHQKRYLYNIWCVAVRTLPLPLTESQQKLNSIWNSSHENLEVRNKKYEKKINKSIVLKNYYIFPKYKKNSYENSILFSQKMYGKDFSCVCACIRK